MNKKLKQAILLILLAIVLITMILQFKYFGTDRYWIPPIPGFAGLKIPVFSITVLVLIIAWLVSKWLQNQNV